MDPAFEYAEGLAYELRVGGRSRRREFSKSDQFAPELIHFSDCVLHDREPQPSGAEGLADVRVLEALRRSLETGQLEALHTPEPQPRRPTLRQELRRPPVRRPKLVHASPP